MLPRMKIYTVHIKPGPGAAENPVFVREGFNIAAFIFTGLWALYQRLWGVALLILAVNMAVILLGKAYIFTPPAMAIIQLGIQVLVGFHANDWLRARLRRKGHIIADIAAGDSLLRAEQRYFERYLSASA